MSKRKKNMLVMPVSTLRPLPNLPRITDLAHERIAVDEVYRWDARHTIGAPHAILQYTVRGEGRMDYRNRTYRLTPGSAFFVYNMDPDMSYYSLADSKEEWEILWCNISPGETLAADMIDRNGPVYRLSPDSWFLGQVRHHLHSGQDFVQLSLADNMKLLYGLLIELTESSTRIISEDASGQLMHAFCEFVHSHMSSPITVASAAKHLKVSREHLTRTCQEQLHISPGSYINQTKIREAMRLLDDPQHIVKEVAFMLGYSHASHFARIFRRMVGVSPQEFRSAPQRYTISTLVGEE